jgi:hypothetical protein
MMDPMITPRLRIKELEETLTNSTPLLAVVGAGDLAVEKIRAAREELIARRTTFDPKAFREQAQATFLERLEALQAEMQTAPEQLRELPDKAQELPVKAQEWPARAQALVAEVLAAAFTAYGDLAGRGKTVVSSARGEHPVVEHTKPVTRPAASASRSTTSRTATSRTTTGGTATSRTATGGTTTSLTTTGSTATTATRKPAAKRPTTKSAAAKTTTTSTTTKSGATKKAPSTRKTTKSSAGKS